MVVGRYSSSNQIEWNEFVSKSKNATFLHDRKYMDYHSDRFDDHSLLIYDDNGSLIAIFPANQVNDEIHSHQGLTFGGILTDIRMTTPLMLTVFDTMLSHFKQENFKKVFYKTIPHIYHQVPAEEDLYALFKVNAVLCRRDILSVVTKEHRLKFQERRRRQINLARKNSITFEKSESIDIFWQILEKNLQEVYGVKPVHSLSEIKLLVDKFPDEIQLYVGLLDGKIMGGVLVYESKNVAHVQYISALQAGKDVGVLDLIFSTLLENTFLAKPYFDFGISNENNGQFLNRGLIEQKEGFGARAVAHDFYKIDIV